MSSLPSTRSRTVSFTLPRASGSTPVDASEPDSLSVRAPAWVACIDTPTTASTASTMVTDLFMALLLSVSRSHPREAAADDFRAKRQQRTCPAYGPTIRLLTRPSPFARCVRSPTLREGTHYATPNGEEWSTSRKSCVQFPRCSQIDGVDIIGKRRQHGLQQVPRGFRLLLLSPHRRQVHAGT